LQCQRDRRQPKKGGGSNPQAGTSKFELPGAMESSAMEVCGDHPRPEAIAKVLRNSSRKFLELWTALLDLRFFPLSLFLSLAFQSSILL